MSYKDMIIALYILLFSGPEKTIIFLIASNIMLPLLHLCVPAT